MTNAGDYQVQLNPGEMRQLLLALSGIFDFDPQAVGLARKAVKEAREQQSGLVFYRSEDTLETIEVQLDGFQASPGAPSRVINLNVSWKNIDADVMDYPEVGQLQNFRGAKNSIRALLARDDLLQVEAEAAIE